MKRVAKALALLEVLCLFLTLALAVWTAHNAIAAIRMVHFLQGIAPSPQTDGLVRWQTASTWLAAGAELLWGTMAILGAVAAFGLWRFHPAGLQASFLLSGVYVAELVGSRPPPGRLEFMGGLLFTRLLLAAVLAKGGMLRRSPALSPRASRTATDP